MSLEHPHFLIAGTNTGVGKTWVTALLAQQLFATNQTVGVIKWIQTGADDDAQWIRERVPGANVITGHHFSNPVSPHLASKLEASPISIDSLSPLLEGLKQSQSAILIEGSGGLFTPISKDLTFADVAQRYALPVVLVALNALGVLHHCISTVRAAQAQNVDTICVVLVDGPSFPHGEVANDNAAFISSYFGLPVFRIPHFESFDQAQLYSSRCGLFAHYPFIIQELV